MRPFPPRRGNLRGAVFPLLVMILIATAGYVLAVGVRQALPEDFLQPEPFEGLSAEDVELDPATGLPVVPPVTVGEIATWSARQPNSRIDADNAWAAAAPAGTAAPEGRSVTLMATYPTFEDAQAVGQELAAAVGDPQAEAAWLEAAGVEPGDGFEWLGPEGAAVPFAQVVDRRLLVSGLRWNEAYEPVVDTSATDDDDGPDATAGEAAGSSEPDVDGGGTASEDATESEAAAATVYGAPLALALAESASSLLVEGDREGDGAIAFDLVCIGDAAPLLTLEQSLADGTMALPIRPPWAAPPLTVEQERARRTQRLLTQMSAAAFIQDALQAGDVSALGPLAEAVDPDVLAAGLVAEGSPAASLSPDGLAARAEPLGLAEPAVSPPAGSADYEVRAEGRRLWLTQGTWSGIADGYGPFVRYLADNGCDDIQVIFHDLDDVRLD